MAAQRPVVVSYGAPFDEYLDESCALFSDPRDPEAVAAAIVAALEPAPERLTIAYERAQRFAWPETARQHIASYRAALARSENGKGDLFYA
jgi:glycosyltransferase involved in cell wall biosynthesis